MKILVGLLTMVALAGPASAGTIVWFTECVGNCPPRIVSDIPGAGSYGRMLVNPDARQDDTLFRGGAVDVVSGQWFGDNAFGFNIAGSHEGLAVTNLSRGYTFSGFDQSVGPYGTFDVVIDGPPLNSNFGVFSFTISRDAGFVDENSVFGLNELGFLAAGNTFFFFPTQGAASIAATDDFTVLTPVPEPGTAVLFATGMAAAWRARRRRMP